MFAERETIKRNLLVALFAALMAAGAFIRIPAGPVPITITTLFVILSGMLLGPKGGTLSVILYLITGTAGLPVFAGGSGPAVFAGPTGGYLFGYIPAALAAGFISSAGRGRRQAITIFRDSAAVVAATLMIYIFGVPWLKWRLGLEWNSAMAAGMIPFLPGDAVKAVSAVAVKTVLNKTVPELLPVRD